MSTVICYFSGTGNSLYVAKKIAEVTNGELLSISSVVINKHPISSEADIIGIVFPCYLAQLHGIPLIVEQFCYVLKKIRPQYIFAICTYGCFGPVNALPTLVKLEKLIRSNGQVLSAAFSIKLPLNNLDYDHVPVPINRNHEIMYGYTQAKIQKFYKVLSKYGKTRYRFIKTLFYYLISPMLKIMGKHIIELLRKTAKEPGDSKLTFRELIYRTDKSITVNENCNGCGICEKVCPVNNILLKNKKPFWLHHCEMCFACDEWCPKKAIHHWGKLAGKDYHHPDVKITDMLHQTAKNDGN